MNKKTLSLPTSTSTSSARIRPQAAAQIPTQIRQPRRARLSLSPALSISLFLFIGVILLNSNRSVAQPTIPDDCYGGTLYYVAFPDTTTHQQDARYISNAPETYQLLIYSPVDQVITITQDGIPSITKQVVGGRFLEFDTDELTVPIVTEANVVQTNALEVKSESPIILYAFMSTNFGGGAFTPLPVDAWGREYVAATWPADYVNSHQMEFDLTGYESTRVEAPAEIMIIAAHDNTEVSIRPTDQLDNCSNCTNVTLQMGQSYLVRSKTDTTDSSSQNPSGQFDIAGTTITASRPIGVVSGNSRTWVESPPKGHFFFGNTVKDLSVEWLRPVEDHGTEFAILPTWNRIHPSQEEKRTLKAEFLRLYGTDRNETEFRYAANYAGDSIIDPYTNLAQSEVGTVRMSDVETARVIYSSNPAAAFQSTKGMTYLLPPTRDNIFLTWGTYMVELVPRESWGSIAPFRAPLFADQQESDSILHFVNVVTDSMSAASTYLKIGDGTPIRFEFNEGVIAGSDLVWGWMQISSGVDYVLYSESGATFSGMVYGSRRGFERLRVGDTSGENEKEEKEQTARESHGESRGEISQYEERSAQMYAYPLAASRCLSGAALNYRVIETDNDCGLLQITLVANSDTVPRLRVAELQGTASQNSMLTVVSPAGGNVDGRLSATIEITPVDPYTPANATFMFDDHSGSGSPVEIPYRYNPKLLTPTTSPIDFGSYSNSSNQLEESVTLRNETSFSVELRRLHLSLKNSRYSIIRTEPMTNWEDSTAITDIPPGDSIVVYLRLNASGVSDSAITDTLVASYNCLMSSTPLIAKRDGPSSTQSGSNDQSRKGSLSLQIAPNPVDRIIEVRYRTPQSGPLRISLIDATGREVGLIFDGTITDTNGTISYDVNDLPPGIYFIHMSSAEGEVVEKAIRKG